MNRPFREQVHRQNGPLAAPLCPAAQPNVPGELQLRCQGRVLQLGRQSDMMRADYLSRQQTDPPRRPAGLPASAASPQSPSPSRHRKPP